MFGDPRLVITSVNKSIYNETVSTWFYYCPKIVVNHFRICVPPNDTKKLNYNVLYNTYTHEYYHRTSNFTYKIRIVRIYT